MNSLLINAGIPQLRCVFAGGHYVYEQKIPESASSSNYPSCWVPVDVQPYWKQFNTISRQGKSL